jgi:hypothetical protein
MTLQACEALNIVASDTTPTTSGMGRQDRHLERRCANFTNAMDSGLIAIQRSATLITNDNARNLTSAVRQEK